MAKTLLKVQQKINKKKSPIHPKGRKAQILARASLREERVNKKKLIHTMKKTEENQIVDFIQEYINTPEALSQETFNLEEMKSLIETFINRDVEELDNLRAARRPGRPTTKRHDILEFRIKQERHFYLTGWKVPDLRDPVNVTKLRLWQGGHGGLTSIKFVIVKKQGSPEDTVNTTPVDTEMS